MGENDVRDVTDEFVVEDAARPGTHTHASVRETDAHRLAQRQKQVDMGKNTLGYQRYRAAVPREKRPREPQAWTPDIHKACSKRAFDGVVKKWRRMLHEWDPSEGEEGASNPEAPEEAALQAHEGFELVSHADAAPAAADHAAEQDDRARHRQRSREQRERVPGRRDPIRERPRDGRSSGQRRSRSPARGAAAGPNSRGGRQTTSGLPLKVETALRGSKRSRQQAESGSGCAWTNQRQAGSEPLPAAAAAQVAARAAVPGTQPLAERCMTRPSVVTLPLSPRDPEAERGLPEVDWGEDSDDDWQVVQAGSKGAGIGQSQEGFTVYNVPCNWGTPSHADDDIDVAI